MQRKNNTIHQPNTTIPTQKGDRMSTLLKEIINEISTEEALNTLNEPKNPEKTGTYTIKIHQSTRTATIPVIAKDPETAIEGARLYLARHIDKLHFKAETNYIIEEAPMSGGK
jgi:uncharacterized protein YihD (DUF1040 family)